MNCSQTTSSQFAVTPLIINLYCRLKAPLHMHEFFVGLAIYRTLSEDSEAMHIPIDSDQDIRRERTLACRRRQHIRGHIYTISNPVIQHIIVAVQTIENRVTAEKYTQHLD